MDRNSTNKSSKTYKDDVVSCNKVKKDLEDLEIKILDCPGLLGCSFIKDDEIIPKIRKIVDELPQVIEEARNIVAQKESIIADARHHADAIIDEGKNTAERIVNDAQIESQRLVDETYVKNTAARQADEITAKASEFAAQSIAYANNYVENAFDSILQGIEYLKNDATDAKQKITNNISSKLQEYSIPEEHNSLMENDYINANYNQDNATEESDGYEEYE